MVKTAQAAIVVLLFCVSAGFRTEPAIRPAQGLVPLNVKGSFRRPLGTLRMTRREVDEVLTLLKLDQTDPESPKSLIVYSSLTPGKANQISLEFASEGESQITLHGKVTTERYVTIDRRSPCQP